MSESPPLSSPAKVTKRQVRLQQKPIRTFKILSLLLSYPTRELQAATEDFAVELAREGLVALPPLLPLISELRDGDLYELEARHVDLFERSRTLSLHLFEHVHGESRDRGQALVDLAALYARHGLVVAARELPDYLPLFLEFLAHVPLATARELVAQPLHVIAALRERHEKRASPYAAVFAAIEELAEWQPARADIETLLAVQDDDPDDLEALDATWEDSAVTFGPDPAAGCPRRGETPC